MTEVSVIIVSNKRTSALERCVTGLAQMDHREFELVVVCDTEAAQALRQRPDASRIKISEFNEPNISAARNIGIRCAAGDVIAFIDDDAVPEPSWLDRLTAPFSNPDVTATGGFVRGRNGVSFQWRASMADSAGRSAACAETGALPKGWCRRTEGTCMAFRRDALIAAGGFDEAFHFFLDETDVNRRMEGFTVVVPDAEVHHGFAASTRRRADRVPRSLFEIGASTAVFLTKHAPDQIGSRQQEVRREQKARALRHMVTGRIEPRDVAQLLASLDAGFDAGVARIPKYLVPQTAKSRPVFQRFPQGEAGPKVLISGDGKDRAALLAEARACVANGARPTLIIFHNDIRFLQVGFSSDGIWLHEGGRFGRGERHEPYFRRATLAERIPQEVDRIVHVRGGFLRNTS